MNAENSKLTHDLTDRGESKISGKSGFDLTHYHPKTANLSQTLGNFYDLALPNITIHNPFYVS
jgi:hypothetical protein